MQPKPGQDLLRGAVDGHIHACPHINARSLNVFDAVRDAAAAGMRGIGLMDNFANSSGFAALARCELAGFAIDVWGGLIMEPPAGGVSADAVRIALAYGYGDGTGARFISLPTHHTRHIARLEGRSPIYTETCLAIPETGPLPPPLPEILDLIAERDVVFNTGHLSGPEAVRAVEAAKDRGVRRILVPASQYDDATIVEIARLGAYVEFSFFFVSHATQVALTHVDAERHQTPPASAMRVVDAIRAAGAESCVLSSDCGVYLLPPPAEGLREFLLLLETCGLSRTELRRMSADNPAWLFKVGEA